MRTQSFETEASTGNKEENGQVERKRYIIALVVVSTVLIAAGALLSRHNWVGETSAVETRRTISSGGSVDSDDFPYVVKVYCNANSKEERCISAICTGVILDAKHVLTAKHCAQVEILHERDEYDIAESEAMSIRAGTVKESETGQTKEVSKITAYTREDTLSTGGDDLVILELKDSLDMSGDTVGTPTIVSFAELVDSKSLGNNDDVYAVGWGMTNDGEDSTYLRKTTMKYHGCTGGDCIVRVKSKTRNSWVCPGDSGGPLLYKKWGTYYLVGIASKAPVANTESGHACQTKSALKDSDDFIYASYWDAHTWIDQQL